MAPYGCLRAQDNIRTLYLLPKLACTAKVSGHCVTCNLTMSIILGGQVREIVKRYNFGIGRMPQANMRINAGHPSLLKQWITVIVKAYEQRVSWPMFSYKLDDQLALSKVTPHPPKFLAQALH